MNKRHLYWAMGLLIATGMTGCGGANSKAPPSAHPPTTYSLTIDSFGSGTITSQPGGGTCQTSCMKSFTGGTQVTLTAIPASGEQFVNWAGCDSVSGNQCTVTMMSDRLVLPTFASNVPVQLQPDVTVLNTTTMNSIVAQTGNAVFFAAGTNAVMNLATGSVIVGHSGTVGVLGRVTSEATLPNGVIEVALSPTTLSDVIQSGTLWYTTPLAVSQAKLATLAVKKGVRLVLDRSSSSCGSSAGNQFVLSLTNVFVDGTDSNANVTVNGCLTVTVTPDMAFNWQLFTGLQQLRVAFATTSTQQLSVNVNALQQQQQSILLAQIPFDDIPLSPVVWLTPELDVYLNLSVNENGTVQTSVTASESQTAGIQYLQGDGWQPVWIYNSQPPTYQLPEFQAQGSATASVEPDFSVEVDYLAGPFLALKGYIKADAWAETGSSTALGWNLYDGFAADAGLEVDPFGWDIGAYSVTLYNHSNLIASGSTGTLDDTAPPSVPQGVTATAVSSSEIDVTWEPSTDDSAVKDYEVFKNSSLWKTVNGTSVSDTTLPPDSKACYSIEAVDVGGNISGLSNPACATTPPASNSTPPTAPLSPTINAITGNSISLSWQPSTSNVGVTGYVIYRNSAPISRVTSNVLNYTDAPLSSGTRYCYTISAFDAMGNISAHSSPVCATTPTTTPICPTGSTCLFVANYGSNTISVFDPSGNPLSVPAGAFPNLDGPDGMVYDPADGDLYVTNLGNNTVTIYDLDGNQVANGSAFSNLPSIAGNAEDIVFDKQDGNFFINDAVNNQIYEYNSSGAPVSLPAGAFPGLNEPFGLLFNPMNQLIYVANSGNDMINAYTTSGTPALLSGSFAGLQAPDDFVFDKANGNLYVTEFEYGGFGSCAVSGIAEFDSNGNPITPSGGFSTVDCPDSIAILNTAILNPPFSTIAPQLLYVTNAVGNSVTVYDANGDDVTAQAAPGGFPGLDEPTGMVIVSN